MRRIIISAILLLGICQVVGQNIKRPESYNYQRGLEAMQEEKLQEALDYFNKDLKKMGVLLRQLIWQLSICQRKMLNMLFSPIQLVRVSIFIWVIL